MATPEPKPFGAEFVIVVPLLERIECCTLGEEWLFKKIKFSIFIVAHKVYSGKKIDQNVQNLSKIMKSY